MGNEVKTVFSADDKQIQAALQKQARELTNLKEKYAQLAKESKKAGDATADTILSGMQQFRMMDTAANVAKVAWDQLLKTYAQHRQQLDELGRKAVDTQKKLAGTLLATGDLANKRAITQQLGDVRALRSDSVGVFESVSMAAPHLKLADRIATTREVMGLASAGHVDYARQVGNVAANITGVQGKSANDAADLAQALTEISGEDAGELTGEAYKRTAAIMRDKLGVSLEGSFALGIEAKKADVQQKTLETAISAATDGTLKHKKGDKAYNRFVDAGSYDRLMMLIAGGEESASVLGQGAANKMGQINMEDVNRTASYLAESQSTNLVNRRAGELKTKFSESYIAYQQQVDEEDFGDQYAAEGTRRAQTAKGLENYFNKNKYGYAGRMVARGSLMASNVLGDVMEDIGFAPESEETRLRGAGFDNDAILEILRQQEETSQAILAEMRSQRPQFTSVTPNPE